MKLIVHTSMFIGGVLEVEGDNLLGGQTETQPRGNPVTQTSAVVITDRSDGNTANPTNEEREVATLIANYVLLINTAEGLKKKLEEIGEIKVADGNRTPELKA